MGKNPEAEQEETEAWKGSRPAALWGRGARPHAHAPRAHALGPHTSGGTLHGSPGASPRQSCPQGALGGVWAHLWSSPWGGGRDAAQPPAVSRTAPQRTTAGQGDPAPISVGTCMRRGQHTLDPGVLGPGRACASGRPRPPAGRPRRGPSPALRVSVGFGRGRGGRERRRVPAAEWHLVTVTSPFVCRLNRSLGGYI